jgi:hypothetical protein
VDRDDSGVKVKILDRRNNAGLSSPSEGLGQHFGKTASSYQLSRCSKTSSGMGVGVSSRWGIGRAEEIERKVRR